MVRTVRPQLSRPTTTSRWVAAAIMVVVGLILLVPALGHALERALAPYGAWISGVRRDQSPSRAGLKKISWSERHNLWRIHPFADWSEKRVRAYLEVNEIPYNPLHDKGYPSIGCIPCTRPVRSGEDERAGRWAGSGKLECGIHLDGSNTERH